MKQEPVIEQLFAPCRVIDLRKLAKNVGIIRGIISTNPVTPRFSMCFLKRYIEALIYQAVAENMASEQSARMVAMKAASDNAKKLIGDLQLVL